MFLHKRLKSLDTLIFPTRQQEGTTNGPQKFTQVGSRLVKGQGANIELNAKQTEHLPCSCGGLRGAIVQGSHQLNHSIPQPRERLVPKGTALLTKTGKLVPQEIAQESPAVPI